MACASARKALSRGSVQPSRKISPRGPVSDREEDSNACQDDSSFHSAFACRPTLRISGGRNRELARGDDRPLHPLVGPKNSALSWAAGKLAEDPTDVLRMDQLMPDKPPQRFANRPTVARLFVNAPVIGGVRNLAQER